MANPSSKLDYMSSLYLVKYVINYFISFELASVKLLHNNNFIQIFRYNLSSTDDGSKFRGK